MPPWRSCTDCQKWKDWEGVLKDHTACERGSKGVCLIRSSVLNLEWQPIKWAEWSRWSDYDSTATCRMRCKWFGHPGHRQGTAFIYLPLFLDKYQKGSAFLKDTRVWRILLFKAVQNICNLGTLFDKLQPPSRDEKKTYCFLVALLKHLSKDRYIYIVLFGFSVNHEFSGLNVDEVVQLIPKLVLVHISTKLNYSKALFPPLCLQKHHFSAF